MASFLLPIAVLVAVGAALYGRALFFDFTHFDDAPLIVAHARRSRIRHTRSRASTATPSHC
jgi:hypothetical protein